MGVVGRITLGRLAIMGATLAAVFMMGHFAQAPALADNEAQLSLSVSGCSSDECDLDTGESFTLSVNVDEAPEDGYILVQSFIDYGPNLTYNITESAADEIVWPDGIPDVFVRDSSVAPLNPNQPIPSGTVLHGGLTGVIPPLPLSTYEGTVFELAFTCSDSISTNNVQLLPSGDPVAGTNGAVFTTVTVVDEVDVTTQIVPKVNSVTINCGEEPEEPEEPTPTPDGDGVTDFPSSGSGPLSAADGGSSAMLWLMIAALVVAGAASLGAVGLRAARSRQE